VATKRCLSALEAAISDASPSRAPILDCGESGSTLRFLAPIAAALGLQPEFVRRGRLAERPFRRYDTLAAGLHTLPGDVSSQFVTGLLFALPLLKDDSQIRFSSPLESRGYVDMTVRVIRDAGVRVREVSDGFDVAGGQRFRPQSTVVEGDWSGAAFWLAMNALGSRVEVTNLNRESVQPDRAVVELLARIVGASASPVVDVDVAQCPDIFPVLTVVAAAMPHRTRFSGIRRLRLKECDRVAAMADVLARFGREAVVTDGVFEVGGGGLPFCGGEFTAHGDHRIAMSVAVGATVAAGEVGIDDCACADKSYPGFFEKFAALH